jgi:hypothetical protein
MSAVDESFCCMVLLKARDRIDALLALLPEMRRDQIHQLLEQMQGETEAQLRSRTHALRRPHRLSEKYSLRFRHWVSRPF